MPIDELAQQSEGHFQLRVSYHKEGAEQARAYRQFEAATAQGHAGAHLRFGIALFNGAGVVLDKVGAARQLELAATQG